MLKPGDRVNLFYQSTDGGRVEDHYLLVEEYDNGLLKVSKEQDWLRGIRKARGKKPGPQKETVVFNLRSIDFLKAELVEERSSGKDTDPDT